MKILLIFIAIFHFSSAQLPLVNGTCPDYSACRGDFNYTFEAIKGHYYFYAVTPMAFDPNNICGYMNFINQTGDKIWFETVPGSNVPNVEPAYNSMTFNNEGEISFVRDHYGASIPMVYETIAMTSEYIISVACLECGFYSKEGSGVYVQIMSRLVTMSCQSTDTLRTKLQQCGIPVDQLYFPDNRNCVFSC